LLQFYFENVLKRDWCSIEWPKCSLECVSVLRNAAKCSKARFWTFYVVVSNSIRNSHKCSNSWNKLGIELPWILSMNEC
jgi:hypothetical protein